MVSFSGCRAISFACRRRSARTFGSRKSGTQCCTGRNPDARNRARRAAIRWRGLWGELFRGFFGVVAMQKRNMLRPAVQLSSGLQARRGSLGNDGNLPLICPTGQMEFVKIEGMARHRWLLCMGLFSRFWLVGPGSIRPDPSRPPQLSTFSAAMKASCGMSTLPNCRIFFLPSFCFSRSLRLRVMSPP